MSNQPPDASLDAAPDEKKFSLSVKLTADVTRPRWAPRETGLAKPDSVLSPQFWCDALAQVTELMPDGLELDITNPEFQRRSNQKTFVLTNALALQEAAHSQSGLSPVRQKVVDPETGEVTTETVYEPMNPAERHKSGDLFIRLQMLNLVLTKQVTQIVQVQNVDLSQEKQRIAAEELKQFREQFRPAIESAEISTPALPESVEGEIVPSEPEQT